ncbi:hypothetical protein GCM10010844_30030 [Deinococcus radiotolerans]|uniref:Uncharacterized protein n=1 Tax=Deinococcus radiotolerans TaxID=1309407 RepID=A0ABQ2FMT4_9DEIO|nr:hypothetical protein GCM10010844_30030 [Deinococcus radiotolerans]
MRGQGRQQAHPGAAGLGGAGAEVQARSEGDQGAQQQGQRHTPSVGGLLSPERHVRPGSQKIKMRASDVFSSPGAQIMNGKNHCQTTRGAS